MKMAKKTVTLFVSDSSINLLVMKDTRVEKWASLPLEPGLVSQGVILDEAQVAGRVKELFEIEKVATRKVIAGLSGLNSLYRLIALPEVPETLLPEAVKREATRVMPISLDEVYLSYQSVPGPRGEKRVFLAAFPRNLADVSLRVLKQAGLEPYLVDLAPLALSRIPDEPRAIIVSAGVEHLNIIVIENRLPQLIRSLPLSSEAESLSERLPTITEELGRTVTFYNSSHLEKPLDSTVPLFVSGDLSQTPEAWQSLVGRLDFSVSPLPSPVEYPEGFPTSEFTVNIGLALKELLPEKEEANFSLVNLNTQPDVYLPKAAPVSRILTPVSIGIIAGIGLLVYMGFLVQGSIAEGSVLRSELASIESSIAQQHVEIAALKEEVKTAEALIKPMESQVELTEAQASGFSNVLASLREGREGVDGDLRTIKRLFPTTAKLIEVNHVGSSVTVSGVTPDEDSIFGYAAALRNSGSFSSVTISSIQLEISESEVEEVAKGFNFTLLLR
jgi:type IV pilus assembly protein PilM